MAICLSFYAIPFFLTGALKASNACVKPMDISVASHALSYASPVKNRERRDVKKKNGKGRCGGESYLYRLPHNDGSP